MCVLQGQANRQDHVVEKWNAVLNGTKDILFDEERKSWGRGVFFSSFLFSASPPVAMDLSKGVPGATPLSLRQVNHRPSGDVRPWDPPSKGRPSKIPAPVARRSFDLKKNQLHHEGAPEWLGGWVGKGEGNVRRRHWRGRGKSPHC